MILFSQFDEQNFRVEFFLPTPSLSFFFHNGENFRFIKFSRRFLKCKNPPRRCVAGHDMVWPSNSCNGKLASCISLLQIRECMVNVLGLTFEGVWWLWVLAREVGEVVTCRSVVDDEAAAEKDLDCERVVVRYGFIQEVFRHKKQHSSQARDSAEHPPCRHSSVARQVDKFPEFEGFFNSGFIKSTTSCW